LLSDAPDICTDLLKDLGFESWFVLKKQHASFWEVSKYRFSTVTEYIDGIGWSGELEFEGDDPEKARTQFEQALNLLQIPLKNVSFKPISVIFAEHHKLM
jgi:adenylate cyclase class IV